MMYRSPSSFSTIILWQIICSTFEVVLFVVVNLRPYNCGLACEFMYFGLAGMCHRKVANERCQGDPWHKLILVPAPS
jgi:hypothetical protein